MKLVDLISTIPIQISNEENNLIEKIKKGVTRMTDLTDREQELARKLASRGLLSRTGEGAYIKYSFTDPNKLWRD